MVWVDPGHRLGYAGSALEDGVWYTQCLLGDVPGINTCGRERKEQREKLIDQVGSQPQFTAWRALDLKWPVRVVPDWACMAGPS